MEAPTSLYLDHRARLRSERRYCSLHRGFYISAFALPRERDRTQPFLSTIRVEKMLAESFRSSMERGDTRSNQN
jgi:hypothetical protein